MMIKLGTADRLQQHLNPSRRKIPTLIKQITPTTTNSDTQPRLVRSGSTCELPVKRCLFTDLQRKQSSTQTPQNSAAYEENQYLHAQVARLEQINRKLERHIDCRDKHLSKLNNDLKDLLIKYNDDLTRMKDDLCRQLQQSRRSQQISHIKVNNSEENRSCLSKSSVSSLQNILQIKQTLDRMDFRQVERDILQPEGEHPPQRPMLFRF